MLTQNLKRDGDSAKSHRALGHLLAGLNLHGWPQARRLNPASFSFPFAGRGRLTLRFKPMLLVRGGFHRPGKSGGPPLLEPSFKVEGNGAHNQSSGLAVAPGLKAHNARGPLKVHPKRCLEESALAPIDRHMTAGKSNAHQRASPGTLSVRARCTFKSSLK